MPTQMIDDRVWFDSTSRLEGILSEIALAKANGINLLLLAHFEATVSALEALLRARSIEHKRFSLFDSSELCMSSARKVWIGQARTFQSPTGLRTSSSEAPLQIIVTEHHPLRSNDERVIETAEALPCRSQLCFYSSLDDPLLRHFSGDSIQKLFQQLGIDKNECISHPLVTRAIRTAQEKLEDHSPRGLSTWSAEDWFTYNLRERTK